MSSNGVFNNNLNRNPFVSPDSGPFIEGGVPGSGLAADKHDVEWFSAMMETPEDEFDVSVSEKIINNLANSSAELQKLSKIASDDLLKASKSADPQDILDATRSMSSFYLQSRLMAKLVSKGSQAVEKLTNLQ